MNIFNYFLTFMSGMATGIILMVIIHSLFINRIHKIMREFDNQKPPADDFSIINKILKDAKDQRYKELN